MDISLVRAERDLCRGLDRTLASGASAQRRRRVLRLCLRPRLILRLPEKHLLCAAVYAARPVRLTHRGRHFSCFENCLDRPGRNRIVITEHAIGRRIELQELTHGLVTGAIVVLCAVTSSSPIRPLVVST